ncbi:CD9 antigen isoform X1 [Salmo salar]|uniref:Tetraspanin n=1 Tax=Salmo salar TaxID=8030 RepID=B9ENP5_SALSA|nr:CD9 antigen isoform X1 [Salmo salar]ACM09142.1 CD9 antigen [Salmo salar]|eukprot:XP_014059182.1 PREDICTED: CD9 antigen-like [Salmo salar]
MALDGCGQLCKCILILFNILFALVGFAMFGLGLWLRLSSQTRGFFNVDLNTQPFVIGVSVLIVLGAVILLVAVFGDYGACNENRTALGVFSCLLAILAGVEIVAGVLAYVRSDKVGEQLAEFYMTVYAQYVNKQDPSLTVTLSMFHNVLHCCGVVGALDLLVRKTCPDTSFLETLRLPACPTVILNLFESKAPLVMGLFLGTAAMLIFALVCSTLLSKEIQRSQSSPPPYILLSSSTVLSHPNPNQDPVFTPLPVIPVADAL